MKIIIVGLILVGCIGTKKLIHPVESIRGNWCLSGPSVSEMGFWFSADSLLTITSAKDTVLRYIYRMEKRELILESLSGIISRYPILKLSADTIIFSSFINDNRTHTYFRCESTESK